MGRSVATVAQLEPSSSDTSRSTSGLACAVGSRAITSSIPAIALATFVTIYVSAQIDATGKAFNSFLEWDYFVGAIVGFAIVVVYTLSGGFVAVAWSDLFQGVLMLVGLTALPIAAAVALSDQTGWGLAALSIGHLATTPASSIRPP